MSASGAAAQPYDRLAALRTYGALAGLALPAQPPMLCHAYGFALADQDADTRVIQDYLGQG